MNPRIFCLFIIILLSACSSNKLTRDKALSLIQKNYPDTLDWEIFCGDPTWVKKIEKTTLVKDGFIEINQNRKQILDPYLIIKDKSKPYFLPTPPEDVEHKIQRVKVYETIPDKVTGIKMLTNNKKAIVKYTVEHKNVTPFIALTRIDLSKQDERTAYFSLYDDGWKIEDKPDIDFIGN